MTHQSHHIPKGWKKNDPTATKKWMESLPTVRDLTAAEEADTKYKYLQLLNTLRK